MQGELDTDHILYLKVIRDALIIDFDAKIIVLPPFDKSLWDCALNYTLLLKASI